MVNHWLTSFDKGFVASRQGGVTIIVMPEVDEPSGELL